MNEVEIRLLLDAMKHFHKGIRIINDLHSKMSSQNPPKITPSQEQTIRDIYESSYFKAKIDEKLKAELVTQANKDLNDEMLRRFNTQKNDVVENTPPKTRFTGPKPEVKMKKNPMDEFKRLFEDEW